MPPKKPEYSYTDVVNPNEMIAGDTVGAAAGAKPSTKNPGVPTTAGASSAQRHQDPFFSPPSKNRDPTLKVEEQILMPSTIETIDYAVHRFFNENLNIFCTTNKGWNKVPIVWTSPERAYFRKDKEDRDSAGSVIYPVITIERTGIKKDHKKRGQVFGLVDRMRALKGGTMTIARRINQKKSSEFATVEAFRKHQLHWPSGSIDTSKDEDTGQILYPRGDRNFPRRNKKVVYETISIPIPMYLQTEYTINIMTEYQQQMNEIMTPIISETAAANYFTVGHDGHAFESFLDVNYSFTNTIDSLEEKEREYKTKMNLNVLGYIIGGDTNDNRPKIVKSENFVEFVFPRERVISGEPNTPGKGGFKEGFYRDK